MASPLVELKNVSIDFSGDQLIKHVNLSLNEGEFLCLIGPSGHGKSVLIKLMAGLLSPSEGSVFYEGSAVESLSTLELEKFRQRMGMLFQKNALFDSLTCAENIEFPLIEVKKLRLDEARSIAESFLESVGILAAKDLYPDEISGGMQKRLGIARALALKPEIIFYDDPTAGLDPITSRKIVDLIVELQKKHQTTSLAVTNDMNRAYQMATRIVMVAEGQLIETGTPEETQKSSNPIVMQFIKGEVSGPLAPRDAG